MIQANELKELQLKYDKTEDYIESMVQRYPRASVEELEQEIVNQNIIREKQRIKREKDSREFYKKLDKNRSLLPSANQWIIFLGMTLLIMHNKYQNDPIAKVWYTQFEMLIIVFGLILYGIVKLANHSSND